jgi:predicted HTH transcriptional regulator
MYNLPYHRNYGVSASVQVAVFDNRVGVTSPGMLYGGITLKEVLSGASRIRNKAIATVFAQMHIIDDWGTGIKKIIDGCRDYGISDPEFIELGTSFRVNIYRDNNPLVTDQGQDKEAVGDKSAIIGYKSVINIGDREQAIIGYLREHTESRSAQIAELLGLQQSRTGDILRNMIERGLIEKCGDRKNARYRLPQDAAD